MLNPPQRVPTGNPAADYIVERLRRGMQAAVAGAGASTGVTRTPTGSSYEVYGRRLRHTYVSPATLTSKQPWQVFQFSPETPPDTTPSSYWRNVRVHLGYVNSVTTNTNVFCAEAPGADVVDILVPENATEYKIYGEVDYERTPFCVDSAGSVDIDTVAIRHGTDWWSDHPAQYPSSGKFYFEIATINTGVDEPEYLDAPDNTEPNPDYQRLEITQIADSDQYIYNQPLLLVTLDVDSGGAGGDGEDCNFTYTATDLCDNVVVSNASPMTGRIPKVEYAEATHGIVVWGADGEAKLVAALDEVPVPVEALVAVVTSKADGCYTIEPHRAMFIGMESSVTEPV